MINSDNPHLEYIRGLDFNYIELRLTHKLGFSSLKAKSAITEYKKFLTLCFLFRNETHAMGGAVDTVWHEHILHTRKYYNDCQKVFGHLLHHEPTEVLDSGFKKSNSHSLDETVQKIKFLFDEVDISVWGNASCGSDGACDAECPVPCESGIDEKAKITLSLKNTSCGGDSDCGGSCSGGGDGDYFNPKGLKNSMWDHFV
jgi:hypothetical protein